MKSYKPTITLQLQSIHNLSLKSSPNTPFTVRVYFDDDDDIVQHTTALSWPTANSGVTWVDDTTATATISLFAAARARNAKSDRPRVIVKSPRFLTLSVHAHPSVLVPDKSTAIAVGKVDLTKLERRKKRTSTMEYIPLSVAGAFVRMKASLSVTGVYVRITVSLALFVKKWRNSEQLDETAAMETTYEPVETSSEEEDTAVVPKVPEVSEAPRQRNAARENGWSRISRLTTGLMNIATGVDESMHLDVLQSSSDSKLVSSICGALKTAKSVVNCNECGLLGDIEDEDEDQN